MRHNQNRRSRSRSRKGPNPLTRSYESNGPDVKVRGTAAHVADKYMSLARDAQSAGDIVAAENYLQHAEHYNRIVMAAQAQYQPQPQYRDGPDDGYDDERQVNGRGRDRPDYGGDGGRDEYGGQDRFQATQEEAERGFRPREFRPEEQDRPRDPRNDRYERRDRPDYADRSANAARFERAPEPEGEPQPEPTPVPSPTEAAAEEPSAPPRRRRGRPSRSEPAGEAPAGPDEATRDGEAALVAFPD